MPVWDAGDERALPRLLRRYERQGWDRGTAHTDVDAQALMICSCLWFHRAPTVRKLYSFGPRYTLYGPALVPRQRCEPAGQQCMQYPTWWGTTPKRWPAPHHWFLVLDTVDGFFLAPRAWIVGMARFRETKPSGRRGWWWVPTGARLPKKRGTRVR